MPSGWAALNVLVVTFSKAALVAVPNAAVAPVSGVDTPNLIGPAGMGGYFEAAVVPVLPVAPFFDELPHAAITMTPAAPSARQDRYRGCFCISTPPGCGIRAPGQPGTSRVTLTHDDPLQYAGHDGTCGVVRTRTSRRRRRRRLEHCVSVRALRGDERDAVAAVGEP